MRPTGYRSSRHAAAVPKIKAVRGGAVGEPAGGFRPFPPAFSPYRPLAPPRIFVIIDAPRSPIRNLASQTGTLRGGLAPRTSAKNGYPSRLLEPQASAGEALKEWRPDGLD